MKLARGRESKIWKKAVVIYGQPHIRLTSQPNIRFVKPSFIDALEKSKKALFWWENQKQKAASYFQMTFNANDPFLDSFKVPVCYIFSIKLMAPLNMHHSVERGPSIPRHEKFSTNFNEIKKTNYCPRGGRHIKRLGNVLVFANVCISDH